MVTLDDLMSFLNDFMGDVGDKDPYMPNGLQVRGREEVKVLATGVSASLRLFEEAEARTTKRRAQMDSTIARLVISYRPDSQGDPLRIVV